MQVEADDGTLFVAVEAVLVETAAAVVEVDVNIAVPEEHRTSAAEPVIEVGAAIQGLIVAPFVTVVSTSSECPVLR